MLSRRGLAGAALAAAALLASQAALAQPQVSQGGVVNAASFRSPAVPGGAIAQGSIFTIFGAGLGPQGGASNSSFPLKTNVSGTEITIRQGGNSVSAIPLFASPNQINAIMPSNAPLGEVELTVSFNGAAALGGSGSRQSAPVTLTVVESSVGIFTASQTGQGPGIVTNFENDRQPLNTSRRTAEPNGVVTIWLTGLGPIPWPDNLRPFDGANQNVNNLDLRDQMDIEVFVGGRKVESIPFAGRNPNNAGLDQINIRLEEDALEGCFVPLFIRTRSESGPAVSSNTVTLAVRNGGGQCEDPDNPFSQGVIEGGRFGSVLLTRVDAEFELPPNPAIPLMLDFATATFVDQPGGEIAFNPVFSLPPVGACSSFSSADLDLTGLLGGDTPDVDAGTDLDAGSELTLTRLADNEMRTLPREEGTYSAILGDETPDGSGLLSGMPVFLDPGMYRLEGPGGPGGENSVGPFSATFDLPAGVDWTNRGALGAVNRSQGIRFNWSGSGDGIIVLAGGNIDAETEVTGAFFCLVPQAPETFLVGPEFLDVIPPSRPPQGEDDGTLGFLLFTAPEADLASFQADGLDDGGVIVFGALEARTSTFE